MDSPWFMHSCHSCDLALQYYGKYGNPVMDTVCPLLEKLLPRTLRDNCQKEPMPCLFFRVITKIETCLFPIPMCISRNFFFRPLQGKKNKSHAVPILEKKLHKLNSVFHCRSFPYFQHQFILEWKAFGIQMFDCWCLITKVNVEYLSQLSHSGCMFAGNM